MARDDHQFARFDKSSVDDAGPTVAFMALLYALIH
jgi:hypothetical protein